MKLKRTFYILKCRTHVLMRNFVEKYFLFLAKYDLVKVHKVHDTRIHDLSSPQSLEDIKNDRFEFGVSYVNRLIEFVDEYWFASKRTGKKLFVVWENSNTEGRLSYRLSLKSFFAHFSPRFRVWVYQNSPVVCLPTNMFEGLKNFTEDSPVEPIKMESHRCDFSQCAYAFEFSYDVASGLTPEVISQSYKAILNGMTSKVPEINKILTGADCDGELLSHRNMPLSDNLLCRHCGLPVFASARSKYQFECILHGELVREWVKRVDPMTYAEVMDYNLEHLEYLVQKKRMSAGL